MTRRVRKSATRSATEKGEKEMGNRKVIDWTVPCDDGEVVYMYEATKAGAYIEALERGYKPVSIDDITETPE